MINTKSYVVYVRELFTVVSQYLHRQTEIKDLFQDITCRGFGAKLNISQISVRIFTARTDFLCKCLLQVCDDMNKQL
jgi:Tfp pilus assembly protein PilO